MSKKNMKIEEEQKESTETLLLQLRSKVLTESIRSRVKYLIQIGQSDYYDFSAILQRKQLPLQVKRKGPCQYFL